jgi:hypothetical protein
MKSQTIFLYDNYTIRTTIKSFYGSPSYKYLVVSQLSCIFMCVIRFIFLLFFSLLLLCLQGE